VGISFNTASLLNGNGIDVNSVVSEIQSAQNGQLTAWQGDVTSLQTQAKAITQINTDLSNLAAAIKGLSGGALTAVTATSSLSAIVTATAQAGATAANYNVVVSGLATTGTLYTDSIASATTSILNNGQSTGDLTFQIGGHSGTTADIAITQGSNDTLTTLADSINTQSAANKWGVTASVVTDASGARLAIYSQSTGASGALSITDTTNTSLAFEPPVGGTNAQFTINGIPYASTTNTVTGAIPNVTLNLTSADRATPVTIAVGANTTAITNSINNFVTEYNTVVDDINSQFAIDPSTSLQGPLGSDTDLRVLQSSLLQNVTYATSDATSVSSGLTNLAALGIDLNNDGTLTVNQNATYDSQGNLTHQSFPNALATNPSAVVNFFRNSAQTGFADNLSTALSTLTDPYSGILNQDLASNQSQQTSIGNEITNFQRQLATQKVQLDAEFSQVNANLEQYPFVLLEITQILASGGSNSTTPVATTSTNTTPATGQSLSGNGNTNSSSTSGG
jgi:flagellar hook-associated protein 2